MATISSIGAGSGLPVEEIITKLMNIEKQPVRDLQARANTLQAKLSSYGKLQSNISALKDATTKLNDPALWGASQLTSSDASSVSAATSQASVPGNYSVSVSQLAAAQTLTGAAIPSNATSIGQGSLTIELGAWNATNTGFTPTAGKTAVTINIGAGEDSLAAARDKINAANAGVVASVLNDSQGSRLVLRSANTGADNAFRVSATETSPGPGGGPGLSSLAYDPSNGVTTATVAQYAQSAKGKVNGIDVVSQTNTISNVIDGLSLNFNKVTTGDISLTVGPDKEAIKKAVTDFASAYNSLAGFMKEQTKYTPKSGNVPAVSGPLQGDSGAISLQGQLRNLASSSSTLGGSFSRLADIGLDPQADGSLKVNAAKLDAAASNVPALKKMLSGLDGLNSSNNGITRRMAELTSAALNFDGTLNAKQSSLRASLDRNGNDQEKINMRLRLGGSSYARRLHHAGQEYGQAVWLANLCQPAIWGEVSQARCRPRCVLLPRPVRPRGHWAFYMAHPSHTNGKSSHPATQVPLPEVENNSTRTTLGTNTCTATPHPLSHRAARKLRCIAKWAWRPMCMVPARIA